MLLRHHPLKLETLHLLDGGLPAAGFDTMFRRAVLDIDDRPADPTPRKVTMTLILTPVLEPGGDCVEIKNQIHFEAKLPVHKTKGYSLGKRKGGMAVFAEDSPDKFDQGAIDFDGEA